MSETEETEKTEKCGSDGTRFRKGWAVCKIVRTRDGSSKQTSSGSIPPKMRDDLVCLKSGCKTEEVAEEWLRGEKNHLKMQTRCMIIQVTQEFEIEEEVSYHLKRIE